MMSESPTMTLAQSMQETLRGLPAFVPILILAGTVLGVLLWDFFNSRANSRRVGWLAAVGVVAAGAVVIRFWCVPPAFGVRTGWGMLQADLFTWFFALLFLLGTLVVIGMTMADAEIADFRMGEYYALLLTATLAAITLVASTNLAVLYLAFETLSLPSYVLAGYRKTDRQAAEASLKYLLFGAMASGIMLYGLSILYGLTGTLDLQAIHTVAPENHGALLLVFVLLVAGFGFKMSLAPFHFWAPDVYQGAPTPITAYLSVVSKAAGFAAFARLVAALTEGGTFFRTASTSPITEFELASLFWILAVLTMLWGNFVALRQRDAKRLFAYSSIAHAGYMFMAFVAQNEAGAEALLFYFVVYAIANFAFFYGIQLVYRSRGTYELNGFRGLVYSSPVVAATLSVMLWSLIGLPPSAGFVGKWKLFYSVIEQAHTSPIPALYYSLVLIAVGTSVVALYYYVQIIRLMSFYEPEGPAPALRVSPLGKLALCVAAALILLIQLNWQPLSQSARAAIKASTNPSAFHSSQPAPQSLANSAVGAQNESRPLAQREATR
ncbi:NADH-ubiquinone oxidoreductase chain N [Candidatus Sumerlaea chitinivorans]|uniref:NADH-quinone oxidoreductase subunit N n=1 Tax=Sumerlaea chitinivorans TaxID=2250252 RepID=A0A2Z4Y5G2_SUMC1|nr:NADH-ubiquinone oxidoreductase chain N [Candidatus Sumerlaea chitinivorans]